MSQLNAIVNINILKWVEGRTSEGLLWVTRKKTKVFSGHGP